jgi:hypothetical protein
MRQAVDVAANDAQVSSAIDIVNHMLGRADTDVAGFKLRSDILDAAEHADLHVKPAYAIETFFNGSPKRHVEKCGDANPHAKLLLIGYFAVLVTVNRNQSR